MHTNHCCGSMQKQVDFVCAEHEHRENCPDALIKYSEKFDEYGLMVHDGGTSSIAIAFCPWCGTKLPASTRKRWFEELAALGFSDPASQAIPEKYQTAVWYRGA